MGAHEPPRKEVGRGIVHLLFHVLLEHSVYLGQLEDLTEENGHELVTCTKEHQAVVVLHDSLVPHRHLHAFFLPHPEWSLVEQGLDVEQLLLAYVVEACGHKERLEDGCSDDCL